MAASLKTGFPNAPFIDPVTGDLAPVWRSFILSLYQRTGSAEGISNTDTAASIAAEAVTRAAGDAQLAASVTNEATLRTAAITAEANARITAIANLTAQVAGLSTGQQSPQTLAAIWFGR
jgi:hypothetical protein